MAPIPRENGVISIILISLFDLRILWACHVAPIATASSGFIWSLILSSPNFSISISLIFGILEEPPTTTISSISSIFNFESVIILFKTTFIFSYKSSQSKSNSSFVISIYKFKFLKKLYILIFVF